MENLVHQHRSMHWNPLIQEIQAKDQLISELQLALEISQQQLQQLLLPLDSTAGVTQIDEVGQMTAKPPLLDSLPHTSNAAGK
jgi:hypothetical protein